jgi:hypothetical protein
MTNLHQPQCFNKTIAIAISLKRLSHSIQIQSATSIHDPRSTIPIPQVSPQTIQNV